MVRSLARPAALVLGLFTVACGAPAAQRPEAQHPSPAPAARSSDDELADARGRLFGALAASDRRVAARVGKRPEGVSLLFAENRAPAELARLFAWEERESTLRAAGAALAGRYPDDPRWRALRRMVGEEAARLESERDLPRGASGIVRTLALDLPVRATAPADVHSEDDALAQTLDRLTGGLRPNALGPLQTRELDDALDVFEKRTTGLGATSAAVARLRVRLSEVTPAREESLAPWTLTAAHAAMFAGPLPDDLEARLDGAARAIEARLPSVLPKERDDRERIIDRAAAQLLAGEDCADVAPEGVRAPIERRGLCALLGSASGPDAAFGLATVALAVDVGRWALRVHHAREPAERVFGALHPIVPLDESDAAHAFRFALAHPVEAISLGWAASILGADPARNAAAWRGQGPVRPGEVGALVGAPVM